MKSTERRAMNGNDGTANSFLKRRGFCAAPCVLHSAGQHAAQRRQIANTTLYGRRNTDDGLREHVGAPCPLQEFGVAFKLVPVNLLDLRALAGELVLADGREKGHEVGEVGQERL